MYFFSVSRQGELLSYDSVLFLASEVNMQVVELFLLIRYTSIIVDLDFSSRMAFSLSHSNAIRGQSVPGRFLSL